MKYYHSVNNYRSANNGISLDRTNAIKEKDEAGVGGDASTKSGSCACVGMSGDPMRVCPNKGP